MKKIMLLISIALTLVSCGVNALNSEKFELKKLPVWDTTVTTPALTPSVPTLNFYEATASYTITTDDTRKYQVEGYNNALPSVTGPNGLTTGSHGAYAAKSAKGSEIFDTATFIAIDATGKISIPAAPTQFVDSGYKIWVIEIKRKQ